MKIGITLPQFGPNATKENILKIALGAENEGFDSIWVGERLLWPLKPQTPYPGTPDGSLPTFQQNVLDPLETLTYVAANTNKIALGTSVIDMLFHNPVVLARRLATLDVLSEGRAVAGLGLGWSKDEYQASNIPFEHKGERADEFVQVLKKIWTDDIVEFKGKYYSIPASKIGPKPIQKPHIPIYLAGFVPNTFMRIAKYADGWLPSISGPIDFIENSIKSLKAQAIKENGSPEQIKTVIMTFPQVSQEESNSGDEAGQQQQSQRFPLTGTIEEIGKDIKRIKDMGIEHVIFALVGLELDKVINIAKQLGKFAR
jgi:probable F420-dependent oxidoreductase